MQLQKGFNSIVCLCFRKNPSIQVMQWAISISATHNSLCVFSLFWPKKVHFKATFILLNVLVRTIQCAELWFCICFAHENMKNTTLKVGYFSKIAAILKVSKFQSEFMKSSFLPKYEPKIVRISAMHGKAKL